MLSLLESVRSLGSGSLLGAGAAGILRILFPEYFPVDMPLHMVVIIGALTGAGLHHSSKPTYLVFAYYCALLQLTLLARLGAISKTRRRELFEKLTESQFSPKPEDSS